MDRYQSFIKFGEPVVILAPYKYGAVLGTFIGQYPCSANQITFRHGVIGTVVPLCTDYTTESVINVGENPNNNHMIIPDHEWLRIDPESSLYKIIMHRRSGTMFQMHQVVDIVDGVYRGRTGFINGIHMDMNTNEYVVRLNEGDPDDPTVRPVEVRVSGWCLDKHIHGRFVEHKNSVPGVSEDDYRKIVADVIFDLFKNTITDGKILFTIRSIIEQKIAELIGVNMSGIVSSATEEIVKTIDKKGFIETLEGLPQYDEFFKACSAGVTQHILSNKCNPSAFQNTADRGDTT